MRLAAQPGQITVSEKQKILRTRLIVVLIVCCFFAFLAALIPTLATRKAQAQKQNCLSSMKGVGHAGRIWAEEHDHHFPRTFTEMTNVLSSPKLLLCPSAQEREKLREEMSSWVTFDERRSSYEILNPGASETNCENIFFRCMIHGHLGYVDGSIFDGTRRLSGSEAKFGRPAP